MKVPVALCEKVTLRSILTSLISPILVLCSTFLLFWLSLTLIKPLMLIFTGENLRWAPCLCCQLAARQSHKVSDLLVGQINRQIYPSVGGGMRSPECL